MLQTDLSHRNDDQYFKMRPGEINSVTVNRRQFHLHNKFTIIIGIHNSYHMLNTHYALKTKASHEHLIETLF